VIEQAGQPEAVASLAAEAVARNGLPSLEFPVPWHEYELIDCLKKARLPMAEGNHSGAIRIADGEALIRQLTPWLESKQGQEGPDARLQLTETETGEWKFSQGDAEPRILSPQDMVRILFDCAAAEEDGSAFNPALPVPLPHTVGLCYI
jgi:hypothetical protein